MMLGVLAELFGPKRLVVAGDEVKKEAFPPLLLRVWVAGLGPKRDKAPSEGVPVEGGPKSDEVVMFCAVVVAEGVPKRFVEVIAAVVGTVWPKRDGAEGWVGVGKPFWRSSAVFLRFWF